MDIGKLVSSALTDVLSQPPIDKPEIKKYYIAYIDILGYKNKVKDNQQDVLDKVHSAFNFTKSRRHLFNALLTSIFEESHKVEFKIFSDNIVLYMDAEKVTTQKIMFFLEQIKELQIGFLYQGFFLRGVVTKGDIAANEHFIFGQGLIDAYELEKKLKDPRIVIDQKVIDDITAERPLFVKEKEQIEYLKSCDSLQWIEENTDAINKFHFDAPKIIDGVFIEALYVFPDVEETTEFKREFDEACKKFFTDKKKDHDEFYEFFLNCMRYARLAVILGEAIIKREENKTNAYNTMQGNSLIFCEGHDDGNVFILNYLSVIEPTEFAKVVGIEDLATQLKKAWGEDSPIMAETTRVINNREKILEEIFNVHKELILKTISETCNLNGIDLKNIESEESKAVIEAKQSLQRKLWWWKWYHNISAERNALGNLAIKCDCARDETTGLGISDNAPANKTTTKLRGNKI